MQAFAFLPSLSSEWKCDGLRNLDPRRRILRQNGILPCPTYFDERTQSICSYAACFTKEMKRTQMILEVLNFEFLKGIISIMLFIKMGR